MLRIISQCVNFCALISILAPEYQHIQKGLINTSLSVECHNSLLKKWENQCSSKETRTCASNNHIETYQKIKTLVRNDSVRRTVIIIYMMMAEFQL